MTTKNTMLLDSTDDFERLEDLCADDVACNWDCKNCPSQQRALKFLGNVIRIVENDETLALGADEKCWIDGTAIQSVPATRREMFLVLGDPCK
jgi:hypothetical protein